MSVRVVGCFLFLFFINSLTNNGEQIMVMLGDGPFEGWASGYDNDVYIEPEKQE